MAVCVLQAFLCDGGEEGRNNLSGCDGTAGPLSGGAKAATVPPTSKACFEDEAEVLEAAKPLHFDAAGCVRPERPQGEAVTALDNESVTDLDPEASSLLGSDDEYAFVYERPAAVEDPPAKPAAEEEVRPYTTVCAA
jgi:hypothetical protein